VSRSLAGKVVVLTGASSGLGRATALELARRGAHLVLGARRLEALEETAARCRQEGADARAVPTDVTDEAAVRRLGEAALNAFGRIDAWINNAGVTSFGSLEGTPLPDHRRVLETNLWGSIHGARFVIPVFRRQGRGVLVNVGSILSKIGQPFVPSYVISKFALRGLSEALRAELADAPDIHVCTLLPYAIDTPHFQEGANLVRRETFAMPPVQSPEKVARALTDLLERPRRERHVPRVAALGLALHALAPRLVEHVIHDALSAWHFGAPQPVDLEGNLWRPRPGPATTRGKRAPRLSLPVLIGWIAGHYAVKGLRRLAGA
jgi:NAD(P)-dependent dehydrogenase (short-subunit alcohol dehydrogenase family)